MNDLLVIACSLLGAHLTYWLTHKKKRMNAIRASSLLTLLFVAATVPVPYFFVPKLQAAFFGATFVGMSEPSRLCEKRVLVAGFVFSLIFCALLQFKVGLGGTLGASAFVACLLVHFSTRRFPRSFNT
jgi:small basic protein